MLTTSYFANLAKVSNPLSISRFSPSWYRGPELKELAPSAQLLRGYHRGNTDELGYEVEFEKQLSALDAKAIYAKILSFGENVSLLCYEKPGDFCHRRLVAEWLERELEIEVPELGAHVRHPLLAY